MSDAIISAVRTMQQATQRFSAAVDVHAGALGEVAARGDEITELLQTGRRSAAPLDPAQDTLVRDVRYLQSTSTQMRREELALDQAIGAVELLLRGEPEDAFEGIRQQVEQTRRVAVQGGLVQHKASWAGVRQAYARTKDAAALAGATALPAVLAAGVSAISAQPPSGVGRHILEGMGLLYTAALVGIKKQGLAMRHTPHAYAATLAMRIEDALRTSKGDKLVGGVRTADFTSVAGDGAGQLSQHADRLRTQARNLELSPAVTDDSQLSGRSSMRAAVPDAQQIAADELAAAALATRLEDTAALHAASQPPVAPEILARLRSEPVAEPVALPTAAT